MGKRDVTGDGFDIAGFEDGIRGGMGRKMW